MVRANAGTFSLLLIVVSFACVDASTYYVATDGSDSNNGTEAMPFLTLSKAIDASQAGDTILFAGGEYRGTSNTGLTFSDRIITSDGEEGYTSVTFIGSGAGAVWTVGGDTELDGIAIQCDGLSSQATGVQVYGGVFNSDRLTIQGCSEGLQLSLSATSASLTYPTITNTLFGIVSTSGSGYDLRALAIDHGTFRCQL